MHNTHPSHNPPRARVFFGLTLIGLLSMAAGCGRDIATAPEPPSPLTDPETGGIPVPTHSRIAFVSSRGARWTWPDIYLANGDGTGVKRLTVGAAPAWSPDGRRLAFHRHASPYDRHGIYVIDADGSNERFLSAGWSPAWASDGRIAFSYGGGASNGSIAVIEPDGDGFRHVVNGSSLVTAGESCEDGWLTPHVDRPAWSPDSRQIAFVLACTGEWSRLFVMNADGSDALPLVDSRQAYSPAWSPDGSRIAATIDGAISVIDLQSGTWLVHEGIRFQYQGKLNWSPDGRHVVFAAGDWGQERIFMLELGTGNLSQLIPGKAADFYADFDPAWSR